MKRKKPLYLCGPTAVGKSAVAIELAKRLGGEIVSVDSMQVYRGMDIGTAKPSAQERRDVPHHLIDVADLTETFDAARFVRLATETEEQIVARGKVAIYCGGTGLYFNALLQGLGEAPPSDPVIRRELENTELAKLLEELRIKDPECFAVIDRDNPRRIIRALEVIRITGKPFSQQRSVWKTVPNDALIVGLEMDRDELRQRIATRACSMFANGLVEETRALLAKGLRENQTASQALGYKQVIDYLDGRHELLFTASMVQIKTSQFAKRQMTWFKRQLPVQWFTVGPNDSARKIAQRLIDIHKLV